LEIAAAQSESVSGNSKPDTDRKFSKANKANKISKRVADRMSDKVVKAGKFSKDDKFGKTGNYSRDSTIPAKFGKSDNSSRGLTTRSEPRQQDPFDLYWFEHSMLFPSSLEHGRVLYTQYI